MDLTIPSAFFFSSPCWSKRLTFDLVPNSVSSFLRDASVLASTFSSSCWRRLRYFSILDSWQNNSYGCALIRKVWSLLGNNLTSSLLRCLRGTYGVYSSSSSLFLPLLRRCRYNKDVHNINTVSATLDLPSIVAGPSPSDFLLRSQRPAVFKHRYT